MLLILAGLGIVPIDPAALYAPRWLLIFGGLPFAVAGLFIPFRNTAPIARLRGLVALLIIACLAVIAVWVAFGAGSR